MLAERELLDFTMALVDSSGIIIGRKGTVGNITLCDEPFWAIDTAFYILDNPQKRNLYFTYLFIKKFRFFRHEFR